MPRLVPGLALAAAFAFAAPLAAQRAGADAPASRSTPPPAGDDALALPPVPREMRAAWVATVANIDWPSRPGLPTEEQQRELLAILDRAVALRLNAVVFQVRPAADALYESKLEPWSEFLTGTQGQAPSPYWDPLAFAVREAHRRGLELHAWFNPFRARYENPRSPAARSHVSVRHPELVRRYGGYLWMDPGDARVQEMALRVVRDVVRRYDIDAVHIDDYFYPYRENDRRGRVIPFPDDVTWRRYRRTGGRLSRDDWRRRNVNRFVERLYAAVHSEKKHVRVGISPFGIWRPGSPAGVAGLDAYVELFADSRRWMREGWLDYVSPQLYWRSASPQQRYASLLAWWDAQNVHGRHLWPGLFTNRVAGDEPRNIWEADEVLGQIRLTRAQPRATGHVHFSVKALLENRDGLADSLALGMYAEPALVPATPWLDAKAPLEPVATLRRDTSGSWTVRATPGGTERPWLWVVRLRIDEAWRTLVLPAAIDSKVLDVSLPQELPAVVAVAAVDRSGNLGPSAIVRPPAPAPPVAAPAAAGGSPPSAPRVPR